MDPDQSSAPMAASEDSSVSDHVEHHTQETQPLDDAEGSAMLDGSESAQLDAEGEHDGDHGDGNEDEESIEKKSKAAGGFTGRGVTLQMLLEDNILQAKEGAMSLEYMGQKFNGDLLPDGKIFSAEVQEVFSSPSAWALRCKKIVNPEQKYGCGWSSVRYCGRPLDVYKNQWMKKRRLEQEVSDTSTPDECAAVSMTEPLPDNDVEMDSSIRVVPGDRQVVKHETLGNRGTIEDHNLLVETITFNSVGKLQPFLISVSTAAIITMEVHSSLTRSEVVGYLGGSWDMTSNTLSVKQAFPCLSRLGDEKRGHEVEVYIAHKMETLGLVLVGWYHSHPSSPAIPTVKDVDIQLEHQLRLKGSGDQGYRPCIAIISSPFCEADASETGSPSSMTCYWVSPPAESRPQELGRPMSMQYNLVHDGAVNNQDIVARVEACLTFYKDAPDRVTFAHNWSEGFTILDKLKTAVKANLQNEEDGAEILDLLDRFLNSKIKKDEPPSSPSTAVESCSSLPVSNGPSEVSVAVN